MNSLVSGYESSSSSSDSEVSKVKRTKTVFMVKPSEDLDWEPHIVKSTEKTSTRLSMLLPPPQNSTKRIIEEEEEVYAFKTHPSIKETTPTSIPESEQINSSSPQLKHVSQDDQLRLTPAEKIAAIAHLTEINEGLKRKENIMQLSDNLRKQDYESQVKQDRNLSKKRYGMK